MVTGVDMEYTLDDRVISDTPILTPISQPTHDTPEAEALRGMLTLTRALRKHEPQIDWQYELLTCSCGWDAAKRPRDSYMAHVQTAVLAAVAPVKP